MKNSKTPLLLMLYFGFLANFQFLSNNHIFESNATKTNSLLNSYSTISSTTNYDLLGFINNWNITNVTIQALLMALFILFTIVLVMRLKRKNKIIFEQKNKLENLISLQSNIIGILAHDIKKPVVSFRNLGQKVNYLIDAKDFDRLRQLGKSFEKSADNLHLLTENILNWALEQNITKNDAQKQVKVLPIVKQVFDRFEQEAALKNIKLNFKIKENHIAKINENALSAIVRNLVDNAIKNTNCNGEICVSTALKEEEIMLSISDNGNGMEKSKITSLFGKNEILDLSNKSKKIKGMGLKFIQNLLNRNNGRLEVESKLNIGSKFMVYLPLEV